MSSFQSNITKDEINQLPLDHFRGEIILVDTPEMVKSVMEDINEFDNVGFDSESKPVFKKGGYNPIALLQISTAKKTYLIRINKTGLTPEIVAFFENENIKKIGIGLTEDIRDLYRLGVESPKGFIHFNETVKAINIESNGLRKLTAIILGFRVSKTAQVSNWEAPNLSRKQINYAATDSWVCLEMYQKLSDLGLI